MIPDSDGLKDADGYYGRRDFNTLQRTRNRTGSSAALERFLQQARADRAAAVLVLTRNDRVVGVGEAKQFGFVPHLANEVGRERRPSE